MCMASEHTLHVSSSTRLRLRYRALHAAPVVLRLACRAPCATVRATPSTLRPPRRAAPQVAGNFHIAPGRSYQQGSMHVHDMSPFAGHTFDFSHTIHKLTFGKEYPVGGQGGGGWGDARCWGQGLFLRWQRAPTFRLCARQG